MVLLITPLLGERYLRSTICGLCCCAKQKCIVHMLNAIVPGINGKDKLSNQMKHSTRERRFVLCDYEDIRRLGCGAVQSGRCVVTFVTILLYHLLG
jgi:hypothetical protein